MYSILFSFCVFETKEQGKKNYALSNGSYYQSDCLVVGRRRGSKAGSFKTFFFLFAYRVWKMVIFVRKIILLDLVIDHKQSAY